MVRMMAISRQEVIAHIECPTLSAFKQKKKKKKIEFKKFTKLAQRKPIPTK